MADLHMFLISHDSDIETLRQRVGEHLKYIPRKKLYRYRKCNEREINTLRHNSIWLSSPSHFPDMFDATIPMQDEFIIDFWYSMFFTFEIAYSAAKKVVGDEPFPEKEVFFKEIMEIMNSYSPEEITERARAQLGNELYESVHRHEIPEDVIQPKIDVAKGFLKSLSTSPRRTLAITSFSAKKDNRNMWENYAGNYSGFCVEYDFSKAPSEGYIKYTWDVLHLLPITYFGKRPVFDPTALLREMVQAELKQSDISFGDDFLEQYFRAITAKGYDYRAENEWRMIVSDSYAGEYSFPYISKIIVGKDMSKENELIMHEVATELSVPMLKQALSENENTFIYVPYRPDI